MRRLSVSAAWEETKAIFAHDGRLLVAVALALIALPTAVTGLINPRGMSDPSAPWWADLVTIVVSLLAIAGQLALIRLAIGPSITVGGAIAHGLRRMPIFFLFVLMMVVALTILVVPLVMIMTALGLPVSGRGAPPSSGTLIVGAILLVAVIFFAVRLILSSAVVSAEDVGPIQLVKRSWHLSDGHWWRLFGFLAAFMIGALVLTLAAGGAAGALIALLLGPVQPMSASALVIALVQAAISAAATTLFAVMLARMYLQLTRGDDWVSVPSSGT